MNNVNYKDIFTNIESKLIEHGSKNVSESIIRNYLNKFKSFESRILSDDDYYNILVSIIFYSGMKADIVKLKIPTINKHFPNIKIAASYGETEIQLILNDKFMIRHDKKIRACVANAKKFVALIEKHKSIKSFIDSYTPKDSFQNTQIFFEVLKSHFSFLGPVTTYHFMTDIGLPVLKPDRVICRIFKRLGLIDDEKSFLSTVYQGRNFAEATGHPIRYIDIVLVCYGQVSNIAIGIENGICTEINPNCNDCNLRNQCNYYLAS